MIDYLLSFLIGFFMSLWMFGSVIVMMGRLFKEADGEDTSVVFSVLLVAFWPLFVLLVTIGIINVEDIKEK